MNAAIDVETGVDHRQVYAEDEISEDVELGSRMHAAGYRTVFLGEKLATGEVPLDVRSMWRQRLRWLKGGHLFVFSPNSVFYTKQDHMTIYQKSLYFLCPVAHFIQLTAEPVMFTMPFMCLVLEVCPYGMDSTLFWTHITQILVQWAHGIYHTEWAKTKIACQAKNGYRVLWFTSVKACINTLMVHTGWKNPGHFKFTPKAGVSSEEAAVSGALLKEKALSEKGVDGLSAGENLAPNDNAKEAKVPMSLRDIHAFLSKGTEVRKRIMPLDGTLDIWVLMATTILAIVASAVGAKRLFDNNALLNWDEARGSLQWISIVFGVAEATPGIIFLGYASLYNWAPNLYKIYVPMVTAAVTTTVIAIEGRVAYGFLYSK